MYTVSRFLGTTGHRCRILGQWAIPPTTYFALFPRGDISVDHACLAQMSPQPPPQEPVQLESTAGSLFGGCQAPHHIAIAQLETMTSP